MGELTEQLQRRGTSSPARSRTRSPRARTSGPPRRWKNGVFDDEIVPVEIPQRKGDPVVFSDDEGIRADTTAESLGKLRPAFAKDGTITAGSASQISDGAAAVVVMSKAKAEELGLTWLAEIGAHGIVAGPDSTLQTQPANAIAQGLREGGHRRPADLDLVEINEAFAAVGIESTRELGVDPRTRSTSTAARSRSATRSACPAPGSCCTSRSSSSAAAAASARPRCAAAAARATP